MRIVVLGIGKIFLTGEGVGLYVIDQLEKTDVQPAELEIIDGMALR